MKRACVSMLSLLLATGEIVSGPPTTTAKSTTRPAKLSPRERARKRAEENYNKIAECYLNGRWQELAEALKQASGSSYGMTSKQRQDIAYVRKAAAGCRPGWWKHCKATSNTSFKATIWNRTFTANYIPLEFVGLQTTIMMRRGKLVVVVSWQPTMVDNPKPADGALAKRHGITKGDLGEVIVWHELGHNYITHFLPARHVIALYRDHTLLFRHLQEFYADLTSVYHCSPRARRAALMIRLAALDRNREVDPHTRAAVGIGSLLLAKFLSEPAKWPSVHLPGKLPATSVERNTIMYVYRNLQASWTLEEDRQLQKYIAGFIQDQGALVLRRRGEIRLPNGLKTNLMEPADRQHQTERDEWVARQLEKAIKAGRADKQPPKTGAGEFLRLPY